MEPTNASANFNLGVLLIKQGQVAQGNTYLETGLRLNPSLAAESPRDHSADEHDDDNSSVVNI